MDKKSFRVNYSQKSKIVPATIENKKETMIANTGRIILISCTSLLHPFLTYCRKDTLEVL